MNALILEKLKEIESQHNVRILLASESGSRAWGFASPDSDYDVRFIYVHQSDYYLGIDEQRDVIELPINDLLDINGWELRKTLRLLRKSNGPLCEWILSPIVYRKEEVFYMELVELMKLYFSPRAMLHHYMSMTQNVLSNDLAGDEVKLKKYFYALRPVMAGRWIIENNEVPPMEFGKLRKLLDPELQTSVDQLLGLKVKSDESFRIQRQENIHRWVENQLAYCERNVPDLLPAMDSDNLNKFFRKYVI